MIARRYPRADVRLHPSEHRQFIVVHRVSCPYAHVTVSLLELLLCPLIISFVRVLSDGCRNFIDVSYRHIEPIETTVARRLHSTQQRERLTSDVVTRQRALENVAYEVRRELIGKSNKRRNKPND
jgi:hypothetical protein